MRKRWKRGSFVGGVVASGFRPGEQSLDEIDPEVRDYGVHSPAPTVVGHYVPNQASRMSKIPCGLRWSLGDGGLGACQRLEDRPKPSAVVVADDPGRSAVGGVGIEHRCRHHERLGLQFIAPVELDSLEVAERPEREVGEARELLLVVSGELLRLEAQPRFLEFDEGACRAAFVDESQVGTPDAGLAVLREDSRRLPGYLGQHTLDQGLKSRRQKWLQTGAIGCRRVCLPVSPDGVGEFVESLDDLLHRDGSRVLGGEHSARPAVEPAVTADDCGPA